MKIKLENAQEKRTELNKKLKEHKGNDINFKFFKIIHFP